MPTIAMVLPIPPDKVDVWRRGMAEIAGPRRDEFDSARRRQGVTTTKVWMQEGPAGPMEILVLDTDDLASSFAAMGTSNDPCDVWFRQWVLEVYDLDLAQPFTGPTSRQFLDWSVPVTV